MIRATTHADTVQAYVDGVLAGDIVSCESVRQAVGRYVSDLERIGSEGFPYRFDHWKAEQACQFFPLLLRHSKGADHSGTAFHLSPWQAFINWNLFGWLREDGTRRFRRAFISVGRKNGKSTYCAGLSLYLTSADGEPGAETYVTATKLDQTKPIFGEAKNMLRQSPHLARHADAKTNEIRFPGSLSELRPLGSDKPFDGLNPHAVFCDELHAWQEFHRKFYGTMTTGSGARTQPLFIVITTAGDDKSLIYNDELNYARSVLAGEFADETQFAIIYEIDKGDDPMDLACLAKANPNLGVSVRVDNLVEKITRAKHSPQARAELMRYHANRSVSSVEESQRPKSGRLSDWNEADCIQAGVDLGGRDDLAAYALCARFQIGEKNGQPVWRYELKSRAFIASDTKRDLSIQPWAGWIADGYLESAQYVLTALQASLIADLERYGIEYVAHDPTNAQQLGESLELEGFKPVKMRQAHSHFNEIMGELYSAIAEDRLIVDDDDPVLGWCFANMAINRNPAGLMMPDKAHSKEKIDAAVASLMAMRATTLSAPRYRGKLFVS